MNDKELERIIHDLRHSLKLMPSSQRELFALEVARYIERERQAAVREVLERVYLPNRRKHTRGNEHCLCWDGIRRDIRTAMAELEGGQ